MARPKHERLNLDTPRRRLLLFVMTERRGQWLSTATLSYLTGKNKLSETDVKSLKRMAAEGVIEQRQVPIPTPQKWKYEFRIP